MRKVLSATRQAKLQDSAPVRGAIEFQSYEQMVLRLHPPISKKAARIRFYELPSAIRCRLQP
ncbi:MAG: hypothetical protein CMN02_06960 [Roseibacillus sp.]|nr:hypothetical protein [Roseibacillus sp.]